MQQRGNFLKSAAKLGSAGAMGAMAAAAATGPTGQTKVAGGFRPGNLYFNSGLTGVRAEARKDPLAFGGDIKEQTQKILELHKANLESMGSSLANVLKVTVFLADVKTEKNAMKEVYARFFSKDAPGALRLRSRVPRHGHARRDRAGCVDSLIAQCRKT